MEKIKQMTSTVLQLALEIAADELYQHVVVDTDMESDIIGNGKEFENKDQWIECQVLNWIDLVSEKFQIMPQADVNYEKENAATQLFYNLRIGETRKLNKDTHITRVPGGWIWNTDITPYPCAFIPYIERE